MYSVCAWVLTKLAVGPCFLGNRGTCSASVSLGAGGAVRVTCDATD